MIADQIGDGWCEAERLDDLDLGGVRCDVRPSIVFPLSFLGEEYLPEI